MAVVVSDRVHFLETVWHVAYMLFNVISLLIYSDFELSILILEFVFDVNEMLKLVAYSSQSRSGLDVDIHARFW